MSEPTSPDDDRPERRLRLPRTSPVPTYAGIAVIVAGFVLIAIGWSEVAGLADVSTQMPYLVSAGITGLALVMVGLVVVNVGAKRQDADALERQLERLSGIVAELQQTIRGEDSE